MKFHKKNSVNIKDNISWERIKKLDTRIEYVKTLKYAANLARPVSEKRKIKNKYL